MSRDWMKGLWPASYKGVRFWVEKDTEQGGLRLAIKEIPNSDSPFIEDLGEDKREFNVHCYLIGDTSDVDSTALVATFVSHGAGVLVLPLQGPITARCLKFTRDRARDKQGLVSFDARFVRDGLSSPLAPVEYLAQLVFDAASGLAGASAGLLNAVQL